MEAGRDGEASCDTGQVHAGPRRSEVHLSTVPFFTCKQEG
jgi:hypothetical protein